MRAIAILCAALAAVGGSGGLEAKSSRQRKEGGHDRYCPLDLTVVGNVRLADGIGKQSVDLIEILQDSCTISFLATDPVPPSEQKACPPAVQRVVNRSGAKYPGKVLIFEDMLTPRPSNILPKGKFWKRFNLPEKTGRQIRIAYTMFESSRAPQSWVFILNKYFDAAVVPDEFLVRVFQESGVTIPLFVIPLGRDLHEFLQSPLKSARQPTFVFANYGTCFPRKNLLTLVKAFGEVFGNAPDVELHLCWRQFDPATREAIIDEIASRKLKNVVLKEQGVDGGAYVQRFRQADCYVNIALGEGFSIPPREAMALGIPVIVSNNTGQKIICSSGLVRAVPSAIEVPALYTFPGDFGVQYQCSVRDVAAALRDVYDHYAAYLQRAPQAREWARQYHYTQMTSLYKSLIKPKQVVLGAENRIKDGGIVTTSPKLVKKYSKVFRRSN